MFSAGMPRSEAVGKLLPELLETVLSVGLSWPQLAEDAKGGGRFLVPRVHVRGAPASAAVFDISFRCGALEALDNNTLPVGDCVAEASALPQEMCL